MLLAAMAIALAAPLAATASPGKGKTPAPTTPVTQPTQNNEPAPPTGRAANVPGGKTWVDKSLLNDATRTPNAKIDVIVQSSGGSAGAARAMAWLAKLQGPNAGLNQQTSLNMIGGLAVTIPARMLPYLQQVQGLVVTPDAPVKLSGDVTNLASNDLWPYESGNADAGRAIRPVARRQHARRSPWSTRASSSVMTSAPASSRASTCPRRATATPPTDDLYGHGTFVAGVAAGSAPDLAGADPVCSDRLDQGDERAGRGEDV